MSTYNAVTWLLDRNVDEGRGNKLAFTDTVSDLSYGELQRQSRRAANMLRRLGVRREERVAMIMLDTVDFPIVFLGAIRAGIVPVPLNTLLTADQYAYVLADSRARVLFVSEALYPVVKDIVGRMPDLESSWCRARMHGHKLSPRSLPTKAIVRERSAPRRRARVLALFVRLDRHAQGRASRAFQRQATADTYAKQVLGISENDVVFFGGEAVLRLRPRQCHDLPDVGRRHRVLMPERPTPAAVFALLTSATSRRSSSACRRSTPRCWTMRHCSGAARAPAHLHLCRRSAAREYRRMEEALRRRHPRRRRLDRDAAHLPVELARRHPLRHVGHAGPRL